MSGDDRRSLLTDRGNGREELPEGCPRRLDRAADRGGRVWKTPQSPCLLSRELSDESRTLGNALREGDRNSKSCRESEQRTAESVRPIIAPALRCRPFDQDHRTRCDFGHCTRLLEQPSVVKRRLQVTGSLALEQNSGPDGDVTDRKPAHVDHGPLVTNRIGQTARPLPIIHNDPHPKTLPRHTAAPAKRKLHAIPQLNNPNKSAARANQHMPFLAESHLESRSAHINSHRARRPDAR